MKKFSNITNQKVGEEPKIEVKLNEEDLFKVKILNLMDQLLTIRTYGPVDKHQRAGLIKISGKEMFLEALMGLFSDKTLKEQVKLLNIKIINIINQTNNLFTNISFNNYDIRKYSVAGF